jgi:hypothetical protein
VKAGNFNIGIVIWLVILAATSCTNQDAYSDGKWWAAECCKMLDDEDYDPPVSKRFMRMKSYTDNCEPNFLEGYTDYSAKESVHQEYLTTQIQLMKEDCKNRKKE